MNLIGNFIQSLSLSIVFSSVLHEITQFLSLSAELAGNDTFNGEGNPGIAAAAIDDASLFLSSDCATGCDICLGIIGFLAGGGPTAEKSTEKCPALTGFLGFCFCKLAASSGALFFAMTSRLSLGT